MIKNNKGFMLTEVIFVSVVILTSMLVLYKSYSKVYKIYVERSYYNNIDGIYAIKKVTDSMIKTGAINTILSNNDTVKYIVNNSGSCNTTNDDSNTICNNVKSFYNISNMFIVSKSDIGNTAISNNEQLNNYVKYVSKKAYTSDKEFNYIIIVEYKENNKKYYSSLKLR